MSAIAAPAVNRATIKRQAEHVAALHSLISKGRIIDEAHGREIYAADAFRAYRALPLAVVLPANVREVSQVLRYCYDTGLKVTPRGGGTSMTGGAVASEDGIVLCLSRMDRVLDVDFADRSVRVEAGATLEAVTKAASAKNFEFPVAPASRCSATVGGAIATNAGGARALKYGPAARSVLAVKCVLVDGEVVDLGEGELEPAGLNLSGLLSGSEGLLGVVVEATLRIVPKPEAARLALLGFAGLEAALACAASLSQGDCPPSAIELFDAGAIADCPALAANSPIEATGALLVVEFEGAPDVIRAASRLALERAAQSGAIRLLEIDDPLEQSRIWCAADGALIALSRRGPAHIIDVTVPPARLAEALLGLGAIAARTGLEAVHMCRATEGIVRSVLRHAKADINAARQVDAARTEAIRMAAQLGGDIGGEHGIGAAKRDHFGSELGAAELALSTRLKRAFDPEWLLNPGKVYPIDDDHEA